MGVMNWLFAKATGLPSASDYTAQALEEILKLNGISEHNLVQYRGERSPSNPRFFYRYYIGNAIHKKKERGIVIKICENTGFATGYVCQKPLGFVRDDVYQQFLGRKTSRDPEFNFPDDLVSLGGTISEEDTGKCWQLKSRLDK